MSVPWIDPDVGYISVSELRNAVAVGKTKIVMQRGQPVAVLIPFAHYLELQSLLELPKANAARTGGKP